MAMAFGIPTTQSWLGVPSSQSRKLREACSRVSRMEAASLHSELMVDGEEEDSSSLELDWKMAGAEGAFLMTLLWTMETADMMKKQHFMIITCSSRLVLHFNIWK